MNPREKEEKEIKASKLQKEIAELKSQLDALEMQKKKEIDNKIKVAKVKIAALRNQRAALLKEIED